MLKKCASSPSVKMRYHQRLPRRVGLSILAETEEGNVLLDTGNGISAIQNADRLELTSKKLINWC